MNATVRPRAAFFDAGATAVDVADGNVTASITVVYWWRPFASREVPSLSAPDPGSVAFIRVAAVNTSTAGLLPWTERGMWGIAPAEAILTSRVHALMTRAQGSTSSSTMSAIAQGTQHKHSALLLCLKRPCRQMPKRPHLRRRRSPLSRPARALACSSFSSSLLLSLHADAGPLNTR